MVAARECLIWVLFVVAGHHLAPVDAAVPAALRVIWKIVEVIGTLWSTGQMINDINDKVTTSDKTVQLFDSMRNINAHIGESGEFLEGLQTITAMFHNMPEREIYQNKLQTLFDYFNQVEVAYRKLRHYLNHAGKVERFTLEDFAKSAITHNPQSVQSILERIHLLVFPPNNLKAAGDLSLFALLHKLTKIQYSDFQKDVNNRMQCQIGDSPQQQLLNLYNVIAVTELQGYSVIQFSYMLLKLYNVGNFTAESEIQMTSMLNRTLVTLLSLNEYAPITSRELWKCDPGVYKKDENYIEMTKLLQGFIMNEVDMSSSEQCWNTCDDYQYSRSTNCYDEDFCDYNKPCNGAIHDCTFIQSHASVCFASSQSHRRYDYVLYDDDNLLGKMDYNCATEPMNSWWRYLFWHCSYCFCHCDEISRHSDRFISLNLAAADAQKNMVVTGVRFVKKNRVVHLQVQEGKLIAGGKIDKLSTRWVPVNEFRITDPDVYSGVHYHTVTADERTIRLDDFHAPPNQVITGVQFHYNTVLTLKVQSAPFDIETGNLFHGVSSFRLFRYPPPSDFIDVDDRDVPILSHQSKPSSTAGQHLQFTHSSVRMDAAQTTVPFFDAQAVVPKQLTPLDGVGLFYKTSGHYGGFVALKVMTYDYSSYLKDLLMLEMFQ